MMDSRLLGRVGENVEAAQAFQASIIALQLVFEEAVEAEAARLVAYYPNALVLCVFDRGTADGWAFCT
eukprot:3389033-Rhodomonas_salina.3